MEKFTLKLNEALKSHSHAVLATLVDHRGSAPQVNGAKAIFTKEGLFWGTIGGGKIEHAVELKSKEMIEDSVENQFVTWNLQTDIGMTCGGEVKIFFERFGGTNLNIAVFGAGHVSQALVPMLLKINCQVTCIDPREEWLSKLPKSFKLKKICRPLAASYVCELKSGSFIISMTQGHKHDVPILLEAFKESKKFPYIGVIGSKQKAQVIKKELKELGVAERDLERLFCPIGLDFGANVPEEIAFSIMGQILTERDLIFQE